MATSNAIMRDRLRSLLTDDLYDAVMQSAIGHRRYLQDEISRCLGSRELSSTDKMRAIWHETALHYAGIFNRVDALCVLLGYDSLGTIALPATPPDRHDGQSP